MSLYDIVQHVNDKVKGYDEDSELAFATNSVCMNVASQFSEVLTSYRQTPPDRVMVSDLATELERRIDIYCEMIGALRTYEYDK